MYKNGDGLYEYDRDSRKYAYPDILSFDKEPFATVIPSRSVSTFKVHKTEGLANSALSHHRQGAKYKQENGVWVKVWEFNDTPENCDTCNTPLDEDRDRKTGYYGRKGEWLRSPLHRGSALFAPFLCVSCYENEEEARVDKARAKAWKAEQKRREAFDAVNKI